MTMENRFEWFMNRTGKFCMSSFKGKKWSNCYFFHQKQIRLTIEQYVFMEKRWNWQFQTQHEFEKKLGHVSRPMEIIRKGNDKLNWELPIPRPTDQWFFVDPLIVPSWDGNRCLWKKLTVSRLTETDLSIIELLNEKSKYHSDLSNWIIRYIPWSRKIHGKK